jgi:hypothetical protein
MRGFTVRVLALVVAGAGALAGSPALAQSPAPAAPADSARQIQDVREELDRLKKEFEAMRQQYDARITELELRLGGLSGPRVSEQPETSAQVPQVPPPVPAPLPPAVPAPLPPQTPDMSGQLAAASSKVFNPDTSVIGNFVGVAGHNPMSDQPSMQMSEVEASFQAVVDPYARADFFLSAGPEGLSVEEGYITFTSLPAGLLLKVGKMRAQFGKVNAMHTHVLPWADRPLVTDNLVGGEDGFDDEGFSVSRLIPNDLMFLEATGEVFSGHSTVFQTDARSRLAYNTHLRGYRDITEGSNIDLGFSFAAGPTDVGPDLNKRLIGVDATFHYRPLRRAIYHRFVGRTELIWSRQDLASGALATPFGFYASADYQFARRWYVGARLDRSQRVLDASLQDSGGSIYMTFWPSEFSQIRGQYRRTSYAEGITANEFLFQFNFSIGAHGAHVF